MEIERQTIIRHWLGKVEETSKVLIKFEDLDDVTIVFVSGLCKQ